MGMERDRHKMGQAEWEQVKKNLKASVGAGNYKSWIEPLELRRVDQGVAHVAVPNRFIGDYVGKTYGDQIIYHMNRHGMDVQRLAFEVEVQPTVGLRPSDRRAAGSAFHLRQFCRRQA